MRNLVLGILCTLLFFPSLTHAEELNIGFVQGLWYSEEPVFTGVPTRIYVAFRNNTPHDLTGTIRFTDNGTRIGSSNVSVLSGRIAEAWVDWTPREGEHSIGVTLSDATLHAIGKNPEPVDIAGIVIEDALSVDTDTDGDNIGNREDLDDDGDGVSDEDERARGTNPLTPNPKPVSEKREETEPEKETPKEPAEEPAIVRPGLEEYLPGESVASSLAERVTDTVHGVKQSLDAYRDKRNAELYADTATTAPAVSEAGTSTDYATITRSRIEPERSLLETIIGGISVLFKNVYTFVLFVLSGVLARPAVVELVLLVLILYLFYRTARYFGRRPNW